MSAEPLRLRLTRRLISWLSSLSPDLTDKSTAWRPYTTLSHDRLDQYGPYRDALDAWRDNPFARRTVAVVSDFVVGDADTFTITSPLPELETFIQQFWHHPENRLSQRLVDLCDELTRSGDLFIILFRAIDGMSYLRAIPKDQVAEITVAPNDWERELTYTITDPNNAEPITYHSPRHPDANDQDAILLHYAINRPIGALFGDSDLAPIVKWMDRYSRLIEGRARLHWAIRSFLWFVTVPPHLVESKAGQYASPPEPGTVIVKDAAEEWDVKTPNLHAADAAHDLESIRKMIYTGSNIPPHWYGETGSNLAESKAMQAPAERHLKNRQNLFVYLLCDILAHAYQRAGNPLPTHDYKQLFTANLPDISRTDNKDLALAAVETARAYNWSANAMATLPNPELFAYWMRHIATASGRPITEEQLNKIIADLPDLAALTQPPQPQNEQQEQQEQQTKP